MSQGLEGELSIEEKKKIEEGKSILKIFSLVALGALTLIGIVSGINHSIYNYSTEDFGRVIRCADRNKDGLQINEINEILLEGNYRYSIPLTENFQYVVYKADWKSGRAVKRNGAWYIGLGKETVENYLRNNKDCN